VVQHAVPYWVYTLGKADPPIAELVKKTYLSSLGEDADLLVWPETAIPYDPLRTPWVRAKIGEPGRPPLLAGMPRRSADGGEHNTAWYFPANGGRVTHYDKRLLVPVMEGHLGPGAEAAIIGGGDLAVAPGICWESVYPRLSAHAVQADLLGFLSDLGALGASDMPWLHARTAILRAVEQRRPAIYAGQTGPSLVIDAGGRVVGRTAPWERATLRATLAIPPRSATLYEQSRGAFPIAAALAGVFLFARALMRVPDQGRRRRR
jgi:apolipoprotein N-acyltransferase